MDHLKTFESFPQNEIEELKEIAKEIFDDLDLESKKYEIKYNFEANIRKKRKKILHTNIQINFIESLSSKERIGLIKLIIECINRYEQIQPNETSLNYIAVIGNHKDTYYTKDKFLSGMGERINFTGGNRNEIDIISINLMTSVNTKWMPPFRSR